jgi:hypothetical protein
MLNDLRKLSRREIIVDAVSTVIFCAIWPVLAYVMMGMM